MSSVRAPFQPPARSPTRQLILQPAQMATEQRQQDWDRLQAERRGRSRGLAESPARFREFTEEHRRAWEQRQSNAAEQAALIAAEEEAARKTSEEEAAWEAAAHEAFIEAIEQKVADEAAASARKAFDEATERKSAEESIDSSRAEETGWCHPTYAEQEAVDGL